MFPRHVWAQCTSKPQVQLGMGPAPRDSGSHCPLLLPCHSLELGMAVQGALDHDRAFAPSTEPEFVLLSNSSGFRSKLTPKLPLSLLLSGLCFGLACSRGGQIPSVLPRLAHHPSHVPLDHPWGRTGAGGGGSQAPACLPSTFLEYRLGSSWHRAEPQAGSVLSSALRLVSSPTTNPSKTVPGSAPRWDSTRGAALGGAPVLSSLPASPRRSLRWPPRPLPVPGSPGKSSAGKAKSRLPDAGQTRSGAAGRWQPGSGEG